MMHRDATNTVPPPSLVETLGAGFRALNKALPALLIPVVLDLWYIAGPRLSLRPLVDWMRGVLEAHGTQLGTSTIDPSLLSERLFDLKFVGRIEGQMPFWQRIFTLEPETAPSLLVPTTWNINSFLALIAGVVLINLVLTLLTTLYLMPLADIVRGSAAPGSLLRRVGRVWLAQLGVIGIVLALLIVIGIPLLTVAGVLSAIMPGVGNLVAVFSLAIMLWIFFTASFAYDAIVLSGAGPIGGLLASLLIIRRSFWSAAGLWLLSFFILAGLNIIWQQMIGSVPGLIFAILSSAYIGAGLAAAHLVFYRDRLPSSAARPTNA